ncbi:MAG: hypothetical protein H7Y01_14980 [Ferruginibacter sp.]|nr:hypothetical protein [Chitinophagaceae bacterium]
MKVYCCFLLFLFSGRLHAQDLTGTWEGSGTMGTAYVKMVIVRTGDHYTGYTYDEGMGHCKVNFLGTFDAPSKKLKGKGMGFIEKSFGHSQGVYNLNYSSAGNQHFLKGPVWPKSLATKMMSMGIPVTISLTRTSASVDTTDFTRQHLVKTKDIPGEIKEDSVTVALEVYDKMEEEIFAGKQQRLADTLQTITTSEKKLIIKLFDNGISDGDSVSVICNEKLVAAKVNVSAKPVEFEIELEPGLVYHTITLVAHNLGSIPPNTATVLIEAGDKKYRLSASSDFKKNAVIIISIHE